jgi:hypothetical protein
MNEEEKKEQPSVDATVEIHGTGAGSAGMGTEPPRVDGTIRIDGVEWKFPKDAPDFKPGDPIVTHFAKFIAKAMEQAKQEAEKK